MFKCNVTLLCFDSETKTSYFEEKSGFYIEAIMDQGDTASAVVLIEQRLKVVPLHDVKWTGWAD